MLNTLLKDTVLHTLSVFVLTGVSEVEVILDVAGDVVSMFEL